MQTLIRNRRTRESCRRLPALRLFPLLRGPCDGTIRVLSLSKRLTAVLPHLEGPASGADWRCFHSFPCSTERSPSDVKRSTRSHTCAIYFRSWDMLWPYYLQGIPFDLVHAIATVVFLYIAAEPMLEKLDRIKVKYGLVE